MDLQNQQADQLGSELRVVCPWCLVWGEKRVDEQLFLLVFPDNGLLILSRFSARGRHSFTWAVYGVGASTTKGGRLFYWQYRGGYLALHLLGLLSVAHRLFGPTFFLIICLFGPVSMLVSPSGTIARGTRLFSTCRALQHDNPLVSC